jgi:hypothetical protein
MGYNDLQAYATETSVDFYPYSTRVFTYVRPVEHDTIWSNVCDFAYAAVNFATPFYVQRVLEYEPVAPTVPWAAVSDLTIDLPRYRELVQRLAVRKSISDDVAIDTVRRLAHEEKWTTDIDKDEFELWLSRIVTETGSEPQPLSLVPTNGQCWTCLQKVKTYRHECKRCKRNSAALAPERPLSDAFATYVGFFPLWSELFKLPYMEFKRGTKVAVGKTGKVFTTRRQVQQWLDRQPVDLSKRGKLCGPMFANQVPKCFPKGEAVACSAFLVRLGGKRPYPDIAVCDKCLELGYNECTVMCSPGQITTLDIMPRRLLVAERLASVMIAKLRNPADTKAETELRHETREEFLSHFSGEKLQKMVEAADMIDNAWTKVNQDGTPAITFSGFTKAERSYDFKWAPGFLEAKDEQKPRFICSPNAIYLYILGRYTHVQTKWLSRRFLPTSRMFYAGCATPDQMNEWLNYTAADASMMNTLVDDVSAMDSSFTCSLFHFHKILRAAQFPHMPTFIDQAYEAEHSAWIRVGNIKVYVELVNFSGVSDTSYKNTAPCLPLRIFAIVNAFMDITSQDTAAVMQLYDEISSIVYTSAAGDDGLTRLPTVIRGVDTSSQYFKSKYKEAWALFGFDIKVEIIPPNRWRMATYLAQRPVWVGHRYEWAPEPARRLRGIFWQFDCPLHPIAWARGVATQLLQQGRAQPLINYICTWYLSRTTGPAILNVATAASHEYSPFHGSVCGGDLNERAIQEFCLDYNVPREELDRFQRMLQLVPGVLVNLNSFVLDRVYSEES